MMTNINNEVFLKFVTSCTKDEAVARMLGWMKGPVYDEDIEVTEDGCVPTELLPYLSSLPITLEGQLTYLIGEAKADLDEAIENNAADDIIKQKKDAFEQCCALIDKAGIYLMDIVDELAKGEESELRIDQETTSKTGITHITIKSLITWATEKYQISIISSFESSSDATNQLANSHKNKKEGATKTENLYTTFAFLVDAFSKTATRYHIKDKPNVAAIAECIAELAKKANKGHTLSGQSAEAIKTRIECAAKTKESNLPVK